MENVFHNAHATADACWGCSCCWLHLLVDSDAVTSAVLHAGPNADSDIGATEAATLVVAMASYRYGCKESD